VHGLKTQKKAIRISLAAVGICGAAIALGLMPVNVFAADETYDNSKAPHESPHKAEPPPGGHSSLASAATNPIANLIQVQLQNQYNAKNWGVDGYSNAAIVQPVIPVKLPWESVPTMVTRTTIPYVTTPDLPDPVGRNSDIGDIVGLSFLMPKKWQSKEHMFGLGPALTIPTGNDYTGTGKWSAGPAAVYINLKKPSLQWGVLAYQFWSFAGDSDRDSVSELSLQPFVTKHFKCSREE
jgi:hypothetical protein